MFFARETRNAPSESKQSNKNHTRACFCAMLFSFRLFFHLSGSTTTKRSESSALSPVFFSKKKLAPRESIYTKQGTPRARGRTVRLGLGLCLNGRGKGKRRAARASPYFNPTDTPDRHLTLPRSLVEDGYGGGGGGGKSSAGAARSCVGLLGRGGGGGRQLDVDEVGVPLPALRRLHPRQRRGQLAEERLDVEAGLRDDIRGSARFVVI